MGEWGERCVMSANIQQEGPRNTSAQILFVKNAMYPCARESAIMITILYKLYTGINRTVQYIILCVVKCNLHVPVVQHIRCVGLRC